MNDSTSRAPRGALRPIGDVAASLGLEASWIEPYGRDKAKVSLEALDASSRRGRGRLVLVSAVNPTAGGEGKTTTSVGLSQGLARIGRRVCVALREPSLGPVFGVKGGGCGGGRSMVEPMEDINLHFTGDIHAITAAHNLLAAGVDNALHHGTAGELDPRAVTFRRALDVNDRALRRTVIGMGGRTGGVLREDGFDITAASEVMAILALSGGWEDLRLRLGRIVVGATRRGDPVTCEDLGFAGAMGALLRDALKPNLVQTTEGVPALVHCGPFGNIAHGCNSVMATRLAQAWADVVVTEAGFGFDLGAEKFLDIKCRAAGIWPSAVVVVATLRALKLHGGASPRALAEPDGDRLRAGFANLAVHVQNVRKFGLEPVVAVNRFATDDAAELRWVIEECARGGIRAEVADPFGGGGEGCAELARVVAEVLDSSPRDPEPRPLYALDLPLQEKIGVVAREIYRAEGVEYTRQALADVARIERWGWGGLPVCIAKNQTSLSDDPTLVGWPRDFRITVREVRLSAGAGFAVPLTGEILTMPGLPRVPASSRIDLAPDGTITGVS
ncbi:formate--tetrahydrofolate ligase [Myxococcota bacterium]|nr:formate--tetrahydrofolate ligase [Myxococcota bacterium]